MPCSRQTWLLLLIIRLVVVEGLLAECANATPTRAAELAFGGNYERRGQPRQYNTNCAGRTNVRQTNFHFPTHANIPTQAMDARRHSKLVDVERKIDAGRDPRRYSHPQGYRRYCSHQRWHA